MFRAPAVLEHSGTALIGTPLDEAAAWLEMTSVPVMRASADPTLKSNIGVLNAGRGVDLHADITLVLIGDNVLESVPSPSAASGASAESQMVSLQVAVSSPMRPTWPMDSWPGCQSSTTFAVTEGHSSVLVTLPRDASSAGLSVF